MAIFYPCFGTCRVSISAIVFEPKFSVVNFLRDNESLNLSDQDRKSCLPGLFKYAFCADDGETFF